MIPFTMVNPCFRVKYARKLAGKLHDRDIVYYGELIHDVYEPKTTVWECTRTMITYQQFHTTSISMYSKAYAYTDREEMNGLLFVSLPPSQQSFPVQV